MLSSEARGRLTVVLVGARNPQNIGAAARAMQDFGFSDLRVVNEFAPPFEAAQLEAKSAVGAAEVMQAARLFSDLSEAIADCNLVVGTTAIGGRNMDRSVLALKEAAAAITAGLEAGGASAEQNDEARVALLFGSEKTGLTREQLSFCSQLLTIPMFAPAGRHLSMNLGQSVAVCLYELTREGFEGSRSLPDAVRVMAAVEDRERLLSLLQNLMLRSGYTERFPANARPSVIRQLVMQLGSTREETSTWMGILRLALRALPDRNSVRDLPEGS